MLLGSVSTAVFQTARTPVIVARHVDVLLVVCAY
jgi:nucleotide-binding universal stress UspA family protein